MRFSLKSASLTALFVAAISWATPTLAQGQGGSSDGADTALNPHAQSAKSILARAYNNLEDLPADLQDEVAALQESLDALRDVWVNEYRPGDGATVEDIQAAREAFQRDYAEEIEANKQLRLSVVRDLRVGIQDRIDDSEWTEAERALYQEYTSIQDELATAWAEARQALGEDATREEIAEAKKQFQEDNAELIREQKELAKQVRQLIRENRDHPSMGRGGRGDLPPGLQKLRNDMAALREQVRDRRRQAREDMKSMSRQEREEYRQELLDELKDIHDDIKERRRQLINDLRDGQDGDRRPEG